MEKNKFVSLENNAFIVLLFCCIMIYNFVSCKITYKPLSAIIPKRLGIKLLTQRKRSKLETVLLSGQAIFSS